jgi:Uncharacterized lipoprotein
VLLVVACAALAACTFAGCSNFNRVFFDRKVEYQNSTMLPPLEVPPDLSTPEQSGIMAVPDTLPSGTATYSEYGSTEHRPEARLAAEVLPPIAKHIRVEREGATRWLVVKGQPSQIWPLIRDFWREQGLVIKTAKPRIGIMETEWAQSRPDIPKGQGRNGAKSAYAAARRDQYRVRLERSREPDSTEIYLTHRGVQEVVADEHGATLEQAVWASRPTDPELEAEMLNRLLVFLGVDEAQAESLVARETHRTPRAEFTSDRNGHVTLSVAEDLAHAWRRIGLALDRTGFTVEDQDQARGLYFVRYIDALHEQQKKSLLSLLAFWRKDESENAGYYLVSLTEEGDKTRVVVLNKEGKLEDSRTTHRILSLLEEQLR